MGKVGRSDLELKATRIFDTPLDVALAPAIAMSNVATQLEADHGFVLIGLSWQLFLGLIPTIVTTAGRPVVYRSFALGRCGISPIGRHEPQRKFVHAGTGLESHIVMSWEFD